MKWIWLSLAIATEVVGTVALKATDGFTNLVPVVIVAVGYGASFYFLSLALQAIPLGIAYAIWSGVGIVFIALAGWYLYGQALDTAAIAGIVLIVAGVLVLNILSKSTVH